MNSGCVTLYDFKEIFRTQKKNTRARGYLGKNTFLSEIKEKGNNCYKRTGDNGNKKKQS